MANTTFNLKCGVLAADGQVSSIEYKFLTWTVSTLPTATEQLSLADRIKSLFPNVGDQYHVIGFDDDGDRIVLPTEDEKETVAALYSLRTKGSMKPVRLCIQPFSLAQPQNCVGQIHFGVECSNCLKKPIIGFRYRCLQCPNYNLCGKCESAGVHPEHDFNRSSHPTGETMIRSQSSPEPLFPSPRPSLAQLAAIEQLGDRLSDQLSSLENTISFSLNKIASYLQGKESEEVMEEQGEDLNKID